MTERVVGSDAAYMDALWSAPPLRSLSASEIRLKVGRYAREGLENPMLVTRVGGVSVELAKCLIRPIGGGDLLPSYSQRLVLEGNSCGLEVVAARDKECARIRSGEIRIIVFWRKLQPNYLE